MKTAGKNVELLFSPSSARPSEPEVCGPTAAIGPEKGSKPVGRRDQHRQLALLAKKLKFVIQAQLYAETGSIEGLLQVLHDLERA